MPDSLTYCPRCGRPGVTDGVCRSCEPVAAGYPAASGAPAQVRPPLSAKTKKQDILVATGLFALLAVLICGVVYYGFTFFSNTDSCKAARLAVRNDPGVILKTGGVKEFHWFFQGHISKQLGADGDSSWNANFTFNVVGVNHDADVYVYLELENGKWVAKKIVVE